MRPPSSRTLYGLLLERAERFAERPAVICGSRTTSYRDLAAAAARLATAMKAHGLGRNSRVGLLINNRREWLECCFAAAAVGAVTVPFSTWSKEAELEYLLADSQIDAVVAIDRFAQLDFAAMLSALLPEAAVAAPGMWRSRRFPRLRIIVMLGSAKNAGWIDYQTFAAPAAEIEDMARAGDDCLILYTSGSSARPKAVRLAHHGVVENGFNIGERMGLTSEDRVLLAPPLFWAYGATNALPATLSHAAALVLQQRFDAAEWLSLIERHRCTAVYTLPSITNAAVQDAHFRRERTKSLRTGLMIGSPEEVRLAALTLGAAQICNVYGSTEVYGNCCVTPHDMSLERRMLTQGPPLPAVTIRIVEAESGKILPPGAAGAVEVSGFVTPGYCGASAEHNASAFTADGYFRTGDIGFVDDHGEFHFLARDNDIIKRAGINVSPAEIENLLLRHPGITQAAVVGAADRDLGEAIVAFVVPARDAVVEELELRAHCRALASSYKAPDHIAICASLPTTETGKLFRRRLKEMAERLIAGAARVQP